jgi:hypothetical protein
MASAPSGWRVAWCHGRDTSPLGTRRERGRRQEPGGRRQIRDAAQSQAKFGPWREAHGPIRVEDGQRSHLVECLISTPSNPKLDCEKPPISVGLAPGFPVRFRESAHGALTAGMGAKRTPESPTPGRGGGATPAPRTCRLYF